MWIPLAATVLLATVVSNIGAPLNPIPSKNHRESTKEILDLEQELKKAAGEDKKTRPEPALPPAAAQALADEALVKELAEHEEQGKEEQSEDSAEDELQQERGVAEKAAAMKAAQEEEEEAEEEELVHGTDEESEEDQLKDTVKPEYEETEQKLEVQPEEVEEEEAEAAQEEQGPPPREEEEEELESLPVPSNLNEMYEDYLNEQRQAYYDAKRSYGDALDNLAEQDTSKDTFVQSLMETLREHPELLDEMRQEEEQSQYPYNENAAGNDREEALRAEYLAATRGLGEPRQFESFAEEPYQDRVYETNEAPPRLENFQNYPSDSMAKVVAKKWGYAAPEEYYDLANGKEADVAAPPMEASAMDKKDLQDQVVGQPQHMEPIM